MLSFQGRTMHDDWKSYYGYQQCRHCSCNVHHLRELTFFEEEEKAAWAKPLKDFLLKVKSTVEQAKNEGLDHLDPQSLQENSLSYNKMLEEALESLPPPIRIGKRGRIKKTRQRIFIERMLEHKESVLAFMRVPKKSSFPLFKGSFHPHPVLVTGPVLSSPIESRFVLHFP
jgi:transposase